MTIECYYKECKHHSINDDSSAGPFCYKDYCKATSEEIIIFEIERQKYLKDCYEKRN